MFNKRKSQAKLLKTKVIMARVPQNQFYELKKEAKELTEISLKETGLQTSVSAIVRGLIAKHTKERAHNVDL